MHFCQRNTSQLIPSTEKLGARDSMKLTKVILPGPHWRRFYPWKSYRSAWKYGSRLVRGLGSMVGETELRRSIRLIFGRWFVKRMDECCRGAGSDLFSWLMPTAADVIFSTFRQFPHNKTLLWWFGPVAESYNESHQPLTTNSNHGLFWWVFAFEKCLGGS